MAKISKTKENVTCVVKKPQIRKMQTYVQIMKVKIKQLENLFLKKKIKMAEVLKI